MNKFITFEGIDGSGKTTVSKRLHEYLISKNIDSVWTREIGGTEVAEKIRNIIINNPMEEMAEIMLIMAARSENIEKIIKPALSAGKYVICDRFIDSTAAYQAKNNLDIDYIFFLHNNLLKEFMPDRTIYMQIDPNIALERAAVRGDTNKFEAKSKIFYQKVKNNYDYLANKFNSRISTIDASMSQEQVFNSVIDALKI